MGTWPPGDIRFYTLRPPHSARLHVTPSAAVKRRDAIALVYDVRIGEAILRKYSLPGRWFEVHCTFDLEGHLLPEPGPVNWAFYCDMCTPPITLDNEVYNVDLKLDILVEPDGVTFALVDEDEFAEAQAHGWLTPVEIAGARRGADELIDIMRDGGLRPFLEQILPFDSVRDSVPQGPPKMIEGLPQMQLAERLRLWPDVWL